MAPYKTKSKGRGSMKGGSDSVVSRTTVTPLGKDQPYVSQTFPMDGSKAEKPTWNQGDAKFFPVTTKGK
jgi:hypothetical protein